MQVLDNIPEPILKSDNFNLSAFHNGEDTAFKWVYNRLHKSLLYFVENIIDSLTDAEDIVASAFLKLYNARQGLESYDHVKRWLFVIVRNEAIDHLRFRSRSREIHHELSYGSEISEEKTDLEMLKMGLLQHLQEAIDDLPRQRKAILKLYFFERKTTAEIAQLLQLNGQTVLNHKARAIEALRKTVLMPDWLVSGVLLILPAATFFLVKWH